MTAPEDPPSFVVRTEAQKAAWDNGFRLERGIENGGWLRYGSTSANREIWLAGVEALSTWPGLRTVLAVETIRSLNGTDKVESEIRYFLSSGADDPATLGAAIRMHWSIENALHWCWTSLSVRMTAVCVIAGPRNLALLRKIALNLVSHDRSTKAGMRAKRKKAAWNNDYMFQLLTESARPREEPE